MVARLKSAHDLALKVGFRILWMFSFILAFYSFLDVSFADVDSPEQTTAGLRFIGMLGVGIVAASMDGYLIHLEKKKNASGNNVLPRS
jgi:hypothetical protein